MNGVPRLSDVEARAHLDRAIGGVAPDVVDELAELDERADLFEEFGLDSMDRLSIMGALETASGIAIPEEAYARLTSAHDIVDYLSST